MTAGIMRKSQGIVGMGMTIAIVTMTMSTTMCMCMPAMAMVGVNGRLRGKEGGGVIMEDEM